MTSASYTAEVLDTEHGQTVRLPPDIRIVSKTVQVRRDGENVILQPPRPTQWPAGFFEAIRIADPAFQRPEQGSMPPPPSFS
jgi:virulence-associated protein VagC